MLASLSSVYRLLKINLRCLAVCKIDLKDIVTPEECAGFEKLEGKLDAEALKKAVEEAAKKGKEEAEVKAKEKEERDKAKAAAEEEKAKAEEEKAKADETAAKEKEKEDQAAKPAEESQAESKTTIIKTDGSDAAAPSKKDGEETKKAEDEDKKDAEEKKEEEPAEPEEPTVEQVEETWKSAARLVDFIKRYAMELDDTLVKIFNSTDPSSRMKDLAESLQKAKDGDANAAEHCCLLFNALTNDKSLQEILRGSAENFEHCKAAIKVSFDLSQATQMRAIRGEAKPDDEAK